MKSKFGTDKIITEMLGTSSWKSLDTRERYLLRESLLNLVRVAKAEQMMEMKLNVRRLTSAAMAASNRAASKARNGRGDEQVQAQFEFHQPD